MKILVNVFSALVILAFVSCNNSVVQDDTQNIDEKVGLTMAKTQTVHTDMEFSFPELRTLSDPVSVRGQMILNINNRRLVNSFIGGKLERILVSDGGRVKKNDPIAIISGMEIISIQEEYAQSVIRLEQFRKEKDRKANLIADRVISGKDLESAVADYESMQIHVKALEMKLELLGLHKEDVVSGDLSAFVNIVSPFNGIVREVYATAGSWVAVGEPLFEVIDNSDILLELFVLERDVAAVKIGDDISYDLINLGVKNQKARIVRFSSSIDAKSRSMKVYALPESQIDNVVPGMFVTANIAALPKKSLALPESAIFYDELNRSYVFIKTREDDTNIYFDQLMVSVGSANNGWIAVKFEEDLPENTPVVTKGGYFIKSLLLMNE